MGNYFTVESRMRNVAFTGTLKVTKLQWPLTHSASQGLQRWQHREGKSRVVFSGI